MATCADCVHVEVCISYLREAYKRAHLATPDLNSVLSLRCDDCEHSKDRSRFVELPCAGDKVYEICCINPWGDYVIGEVDKNDTDFDSELLGKRFFLTPEEAEKALKEREENA